MKRGAAACVFVLAAAVAGAQPIGDKPEEMARQIQQETAKFSTLVKTAKVVIE